MGIFKYIARALDLVPEEKALGSGYRTVGTVIPSGDSYFHFLNIANSEDGPRRVTVAAPYLQNAWVYSAIRVMATNMAQARWQIMQGETEIENYGGTYGWIRRLFDWVSPTENRYSLFESILVWLSIQGECFWRLKRSAIEQVSQIDILMPQTMKEIVKDGKLLAWEYSSAGGKESIPNEEIIQFKYYNPYNPWRGLAPLTAATLGIHVDFASSLYNYYFFNNDSTPAGVIKTDQELSNEEATAMAVRWKQQQGGLNKKGNIAVFGKGGEYKSIALAQKDIQYIEQKKWSREEVFAVLEVPPALSQVLEFASIKSNIKEQRKQLFENNLIPKMKFIEDVMKTQFFEREKLNGIKGQFDLSQIDALNDTFAEKAPIIEALTRSGFTRNEINEALNLGFEDKPWGESWWIPYTLYPAGGEPPALTGNRNDSGSAKAVTATIAPQTIKRIPNMRRLAENAFRAVHAQEIKMRDELAEYFFKMRSDILGRVLNRKSIKAIEDHVINDIMPDFDDYDEELGKIVLPIYQATFEISLNNINEAMRTNVSMSTARANAVIGNKVIKIRELNDTIREQIADDIRPIIRDAVERGDAYETVAGRLADEVKNIFNNARRRTATVARTEVNGTLNQARWETMKEVGVEKHQWLSTRRIRQSHIDIDLNIKEVGEEFLPGLKFPLDPDADASEVINCSCITVPVME